MSFFSGRSSSANSLALYEPSGRSAKRCRSTAKSGASEIPTGAGASCMGAWKQLFAPVWQVGPAGRASTSSASRSQSAARPTSASVFPEVSPLRHSAAREREWKCTSPVASVAASASRVHPAEHENRAVVGVLDDGRERDPARRSAARPRSRAPRGPTADSRQSQSPARSESADAIPLVWVGARTLPAAGCDCELASLSLQTDRNAHRPKLSLERVDRRPRLVKDRRSQPGVGTGLAPPRRSARPTRRRRRR